MSDWAVFRRAWNERKTQNTVHGYDDGQIPSVPLLLVKFMEKWYFAHQSGRSTVNLAELNQRFERIEKSKDIAEVSKLMAEIYRYAYDQYLMIPICEFSEKIATTKRVPPWDPGRHNDRNYYDLIKQR